ncbi:MAG: fibronectin type III domain-containing protein [Eubacterium sp.]|nr:fibronectin type III domain-containing protein [Eubacterium sp.]
MKKLISIFLAVLLIISSTALAPVSAYSADKMYAEDKIAQIQKLPGFVPGQQAVVTGNCFAFVSAVCEKLYGTTYWNEILYGNFRANHDYTGNYYTVKTFTTTNTYPTANDVENIISFFMNNAAPGDVMHYGAYTTGTGNGNTHTVMITSIDTEKMGIYHSNYETVDAGRNTCHVDYIYWDSFRRNPTSNEYTSAGHLKSMNSIFYNKMRSSGLGISINRYTKYESKFYLVGVGVPEVKTARSSPYSVKLSWNSLKGAQRYQVEYKRSSDSAFTSATADCKKTEYDVKNLTLGTQYVFRVRAYIGNKWMKWSDQKTVTALPPTIPSVVFKAESNGLRMTWTKRTDITGVKIYRSDSANGTYKTLLTTKNLNTYSHIDKTVKYGQPYYYKFERFIEANGKTYKTTSPALKGTYTLQKPTVEYTHLNTTSLDFTFKANGKSDKFVYYITDSNNKTVKSKQTTTATEVNVVNLTPCKAYKIYVAQRTDIGTGDYQYRNFRPVPAKVSGVKITNVSAGLNIKYNTQSDTTGYVIYRSTSKDKDYTKLVELDGKKTGSYVDKTVKYNTAYYYKVCARATADGKNYYGNSSNAASGKNTVGTVKNVRAVVKSPYAFTIKWDATENAVKYTVQYKPSSGGSWATVGTSTGTSLVCSNLKLGTTYLFRVKAHNGVGAGAYSANASRKTVVPKPAAPQAKLGSTGIRVTWDNKSYASGYNIYRSTSASGKYSLVKTVKNNTSYAWIDTSVKYGTQYYYKVMCYVTTGGKTYNSSQSLYLAKKYTLAVPALTVKADGTTANLSWKTCEGANKYSVQYAPSDGNYKTVTVTTNSKKITGLTAGKKYKFRVKSMSTKGSSSYCTAKTVQF